MAGSSRPAQPEPVAIIGMSCRFAGGADSPGAFWDLLLNGRDGIGDVPDGRWTPYADAGPDHAAVVRRATSRGGFLGDIGGFDAEFFGLTPREAELMDPQQRILLEVAWEALEHAGIPPRDLAGSDGGVFIGIGSDDYGRRLLQDLPQIDAWTGIGAAMCAAANRISYALDLRGPSLAVDTACSASLVALHLACQSLRAGESPVALAGGVNLIISPSLTLTLDAAGALSPDGRCKSFDATADGYGRGEGCGVLVLKRLADAQRDHDPVLAVILGSSVNQDGRTNGIMAPSGPAQAHLLRQACRHAGVAPESVDYVESHGTGTRLGDPLEAGALSAVYGTARAAGEPCLIGSVKPNIGHLEAAAGVAGMIKAVLALHHGEIPPSVNFTEGNPAIDWAGAGLRVVAERTAWPDRGHPRRAGVSGFGYGGTLAHILLEQAPAQEPAPAAAPAPGQPRLYPLSAASAPALRQLAGTLADWLDGEGSEVPLSSVGHTLALRRSHLGHRATVTAADRGELAAGLRHLAEGEQAPGVATGSALADGGLVWVFSGHGAQWSGMGQELLETEPVFRRVVDEIEPVFLKEIGYSPREVLNSGQLDDVDRIQSMIFVMQVGLAEVWRSCGVSPDAVIGHSVGEIAAAVACGALSLADGAGLICRRSLLLRRVAGHGGMAMADLSFAEAAGRLAGRADVVAAIAASPVSTVVSGDPAAVQAVMEQWQADGVQVRKVASDVAFHSPQMDPLLADLAQAAASLSPMTPRVPMYSTALDDPRTDFVASGDYWARNLRQPVRLASAVAAASQDGYRGFLEVSAHPVVAHSIRETLSGEAGEASFVGSSLRRDRPERATLLTSLGALHSHGFTADWSRLQPAGGLASLPTVPWQRRQHWRQSAAGTSGGLQHDVDSHALLGSPVSIAGRPTRLWRTHLDDSCRPYPGSHTLHGTEIVPAAVLINTFLQASRNGEPGLAVSDVSLLLPVGVATRREVQVVHDDSVVRLASRELPEPENGSAPPPWLTHATARVAPGAPPEAATQPADPAGWEKLDPGSVQQHLASVGVPTMGFTWIIEELRRRGTTLRAQVRVEQPERAAATWAPVLDAALSIAPTAFPGPAMLRMVAQVGEVRVAEAAPSGTDFCLTVELSGDQHADVTIADRGGCTAVRLGGVRFVSLEQDRPGTVRPEHLLHELTWRPLELPAGGPARKVILVGQPGESQTAVAGLLAAEQSTPAELAQVTADTDVVVLAPPPAAGVPPAEAAAAATWLLLQTAKQLASLPRPPRLWCVTQGARECRDEAGVAHAALWGLGRVIRGEHPELWGGIVDLDPADPAGSAARLPAVLRARPQEDVIALRGDATEVSRLARPDARAAAPLRCRPGGTYLITGGLGVLGLEVASWLAERGARRIVLAGRHPLPPRARWDDPCDERTRRQIDQVRALEQAGVTVRVVSLDITDAQQAAAALAPDALGLPPITGIVHAAGVLDNRMLSHVDEASLRTVMRPKADGAWVLHELFPPGSLDFLVLFSSCGQLLGLPGQASYGPSNAFLDGLARYRGASGHGDTTSFGWTSWRGQGMAVNKAVDAELRARGVSDITAAEAFAAWDLATGGGYLAVLRILPEEPGQERLPLLSEVRAAAEPTAAADSEAEQFSGLSPEELRERLLDEVGSQIAHEIKLPTSDLDPRRSLVEQGLDSVMTIAIRRRLERRFGHSLPSTLLWNQPTVSAIADHLADLLSEPEPEPDAEPEPAPA